MSEPTAANNAAAWADLSTVIREYLTTETDVTRPSFHATALAHRIAGHAPSPGPKPSRINLRVALLLACAKVGAPLTAEQSKVVLNYLLEVFPELRALAEGGDDE